MREFQITFEKYSELLKRIDSIENWAFNTINKLEAGLNDKDKMIKSLENTIRFQRNLIHKKIISEVTNNGSKKN